VRFGSEMRKGPPTGPALSNVISIDFLLRKNAQDRVRLPLGAPKRFRKRAGNPGKGRTISYQVVVHQEASKGQKKETVQRSKICRGERS